MSLFSGQPTTSSDSESFQKLKRKALDHIQSLLAEHKSPQKKKKPNSDEFLEQYTTNLRSYQFTSWATSEINPRELAQHGWKSIFRDPVAKKSCVECCKCKAKISTEIGRLHDHDDEIHIKLLGIIRKDLVDRHNLTCVFRSVKTEFHDFHRYLYNIEDGIKTLCASYTTQIEVQDTDEIDALGKLTNSGYDKNQLILACLYWRMYETKWKSVKVFCALCNKECLIPEDKKFNVIKSHRWYCPMLDTVNGKDLVWQRRMQHFIEKEAAKEAGVQSIAGSVALFRVKNLLKSSISSVIKE